METTSILLAVALVHFLAISSPGPTFVVVTRYAAAGDRASGLLVALGVCIATLTWASFAATGLGTLVSTYPRAYALLQYAGAAYLMWLGFKLIRGYFRTSDAEATAQSATGQTPGGWRAVMAGFLTNISNPKVIAYYTSLFGVTVPADTSRSVFLAVVATVLTVSALWWIAVAVLFSSGAVHRGFLRVRRTLDGAMGAVLVALGLRLALSR